MVRTFYVFCFVWVVAWLPSSTVYAQTDNDLPPGKKVKVVKKHQKLAKHPSDSLATKKPVKKLVKSKTKPSSKSLLPSKAASTNVVAPAAKSTAASSPAPKTMVAPALDLSASQSPESAAKAHQEILAKPKDAKKSSIDFGGGLDLSATDAGGGVFDFSNDKPDFAMGDLNLHGPERQRFELAMLMMSRNEFAKAALEFQQFLKDPAYRDFHDESAYQLGKSLYRLSLYEAALAQYQKIMDQGPSHKRYAKSVEWLFFISRKLADQTPVLAQLARYRNVVFPEAYRYEYLYLLAKYLFMQANQLELQRHEDEELTRGKKAKENSLDFGAIANAIGSDETHTLDFSHMEGVAALDFGSSSGGDGSQAGLDFGSSNSAPSGAGQSELDFGAPTEESTTHHITEVPTTPKEALALALDLAAQVVPQSTYYPRARYLMGLIHYLAGHQQKSVDTFADLVRKLNPKENRQADLQLREMAFLSLARIHYENKQFDRSVYYYDLVDRDSENWLTSLFESSWAYYRRGDFEKSLGNLLTLHTPFFKNSYFPESYIIKAIIYFEACRYAETRVMVDNFIQEYTRLVQRIAQMIEVKGSADTLYDDLLTLEQHAKTGDDVSVRVAELSLASYEIQQSRAVVQDIEAQQIVMQRLNKPLKQEELYQNIDKQLAEAKIKRTQAASKIIRQHFEQEMYRIKNLLAQALRIKIEVTRSERETVEKRLQKINPEDEIVQAIESTTVDDEHLYWPYTGEFWRDELGTYEVNFSMCKPLDDNK